MRILISNCIQEKRKKVKDVPGGIPWEGREKRLHWSQEKIFLMGSTDHPHHPTPVLQRSTGWMAGSVLLGIFPPILFSWM